MIDVYERSRLRMVEEQLQPRGINDPRVLNAISLIPRHIFVAEALRSQAYGDFPLPIGEGQTISQPYIVALMTQLLQLQEDDSVLEIGTGCGYQTAVLASLCKQVYSIERINTLLARARRAFDRLQLFNISSKADDGTAGWAQHAPYNAIIVTAAGPVIPQPLVEQLACPGRLVMPVGERVQSLCLLEKKPGETVCRVVEQVSFVKLMGEHAWKVQR